MNMVNLYRKQKTDIKLPSNEELQAKIEKKHWSFSVEIQTLLTDFEWRSPTHPTLIYGGGKKHQDTFKIHDFKIESTEKYLPCEDFVLQFRDENFNTPIFNLAHWPQNEKHPYALKLAFDPIPTETEGKKGESKAIISEHSTEMGDFVVADDNPAEFIFLIDRSGSMNGKPIKMAVEAVIIGLQSMPAGSYFNIISFGSTFVSLYPESFEANQENINSAIDQLEMFDADMGGTEIFRPIKDAYNKPMIKDFKRNLFLMTDGQVSSPKDIIEFIKTESTFQSMYSLGIGTGFSEELVEGVAKAGNGTSAAVAQSS